MNRKKIFIAVFLSVLFIGACTAPAVEKPESAQEVPVTGGDVQTDSEAAVAPEAVEEVVEAPAAAAPEITIAAPDDLPASIRTLKDSDSSLRASEKRVLSGDNFNNNLFEQLFRSSNYLMEYKKEKAHY